MKTTAFLTTLTMTGIFATQANAAVIVDETFGGSGADLNGTTAETFAAGITSAGGSSTWDAAATSFKDDGTTTAGDFKSAYLPLGSYINDTKGTASGLFTLSATLSLGTGGSWSGFGFSKAAAPTNQNFTQSSNGQGFFIYRTGGELDGFAGPGTSNAVDGDIVAGTQLLTIVLDLTTATGYNGTTNFGTITFFDGDADTGSSLGSHTYTADMDFAKIGLGLANQNGVQYSTFTLEQVPEPGSLALMGLGGLLITRRRRQA